MGGGRTLEISKDNTVLEFCNNHRFSSYFIRKSLIEIKVSRINTSD